MCDDVAVIFVPPFAASVVYGARIWPCSEYGAAVQKLRFSHRSACRFRLEMHVQGRCRGWLGNHGRHGEAAPFQDDLLLFVKSNQLREAGRLSLGITLVV